MTKKSDLDSANGDGRITKVMRGVTSPRVSSLARKLGKRAPKEPVIYEDPRQELRRLVGMHSRWTRTAVSWEQSVKDIKIHETGEIIKCTVPQHVRDDLAKVAADLRREATRLEKSLEAQLKKVPIYNEFLSKVYGFGPVVCSYIVSMVRIEKAVKPSNLWRYCGNACDPVTGNREIRHSAPKEQGGTGTYNDVLKTRIYLGMKSMRMCRVKVTEGAPYGMTSKYIERWANASYSRRVMGRDKGAEHAGRRKATDLVLEDLYIIWRTLEGLEVWPDLYSVRRGFYHGGKPCVNEGKVLTLAQAWDVVGDVKARPATQPLMFKLEEDEEDEANANAAQ